MTECSAYFTLRAASARESPTAAAGRIADAAHADAALTSRYSYELAELAGLTFADTDAALRQTGRDLRGTIDDDLANIGRLRTRYDQPCRTMVGEGKTRTEHWRQQLQK